jgi:hypothetical protein
MAQNVGKMDLAITIAEFLMHHNIRNSAGDRYLRLKRQSIGYTYTDSCKMGAALETNNCCNNNREVLLWCSRQPSTYSHSCNICNKITF